MSEDASRDDLTPTDRLTALWRRLKEHRIAQWTVGYVAVAYGIQHAITLTSEAYEWPNIVTRISMTLLALGLPIAMTLAWYHGERASRGFSRAEFSILATLLLGVSVLFYAFVHPATQTATATAPAIREASVAAARLASLSPATAVSLAVLPFDNLSPEPNQGYFVDGMGDEIILALAKIPDLRVIGRESALEFKGKHPNFRDAGKALNATHLLEGSVQKDGDRLRISAELVRADTGVTVWANSYDRELKDVFVVQDDIARSIAGSLHMTLGLKPGEDLVNQRTKSAALHDNYLRARNLVRTDKLDDAIKLLDDFVAREPRYAPAWAELAVAHNEKLVADPDFETGIAVVAPASFRENRAKRSAAAEQALKLDPNNAQANCVSAQGLRDRGNVTAAIALWQRALALDPDEPDCLEAYGLMLAHSGFPDKGADVMNHLLAVEPLLRAFRFNAARVLAISGQTDAAAALWKEQSYSVTRIIVFAEQGRFREAADQLENFKLPPPLAKRLAKALPFAAQLLRNAPAPAPRDAPELGILDYVYVFSGAPERFMAPFENHLRFGFDGGALNGWEWAPGFRALRQTERFKKYARESGMLAYWRSEGWPPQCHPTTGPGRAEAPSAKAGDDFECS